MSALDFDLVPIRVVIADPHAGARAGLRLAFETDAVIEVVASVGDALGALGATDCGLPAVAIVDAALIHADGGALVRALARRGVPVVVTGIDIEPVFARAALRAGAAGFVRKDASPAEFVTAVRAVAR